MALKTKYVLLCVAENKKVVKLLILYNMPNENGTHVQRECRQDVNNEPINYQNISSPKIASNPICSICWSCFFPTVVQTTSNHSVQTFLNFLYTRSFKYSLVLVGSQISLFKQGALHISTGCSLDSSPVWRILPWPASVQCLISQLIKKIYLLNGSWNKFI